MGTHRVRLAGISGCLLIAIASCSSDPVAPEDLPVPKVHTPLWAFEPWISKDISSTDDTREFVRGFVERKIPVGAVVLDSPWETNYNTFVPHPVRYHDFAELVSELHAQKIKVVLWTTQMLNEDSFDLEPGGDTYETPVIYREAQSKKYFVNDGEKFFWWKGTGGAIDFFNPEAVRWWHRLQDHVLDMGIDGWKLDFGDSYIMADTVSTAAGMVPHQEYSEAYYRDFFAYGVNTRGPEFLTMVRGYDKSYQFEGRLFARKEHAPVVWMGDNRRDFLGLEDALDHLFRSSRAGYVVGGSDIGGYLDRDDKDLTGPTLPFDSVVFARWIATGAMTPFMQLHGRANITPWTVPDRAEEIVSVYRYWATLHHELAPFFYGVAEDAYARGTGVVVEPVGEEADWAGDYRFVSGDVFLVAPVLDARGVREVELPGAASWYDWWEATGAALPGPMTVTASVSRDLVKVPLFVKEGSIVPFRSGGEHAVLGDPEAPAGKLMIAVWPAADAETTRNVYVSEGAAPFEARASGAGQMPRIELSRLPEALSLRVRVERAVRSSLGTVKNDPARGVAWIDLQASEGPQTITLSFE
jgi:alpha-D-xyloside xylohydrolase